MNRTRLLMIGFVALALAAFVSFTVYRRLNAPGAANVPPGDNIIIAAANISLGAKIEDKDVKVVQLPAADLPPRHFRQKSQVLGRGVIVPIAQGEYVLPEKLAGENAGYGLPALIPTGMRAVSVRVNEVIGVAGFVVPGTRVDVLLTGSPSGSGGERTTTVLEDIAVIASGQRLERSVSGGSGDHVSALRRWGRSAATAGSAASGPGGSSCDDTSSAPGTGAGPDPSCKFAGAAG